MPLADVRLHTADPGRGVTPASIPRANTPPTSADVPAGHPLLPGGCILPVGYNSRASPWSSPEPPIHRQPLGQTKAPDEAAAELRPCRRLDLELEMATIVGDGTRWAGR